MCGVSEPGADVAQRCGWAAQKPRGSCPRAAAGVGTRKHHHRSSNAAQRTAHVKAGGRLGVSSGAAIWMCVLRLHCGCGPRGLVELAARARRTARVPPSPYSCISPRAVIRVIPVSRRRSYVECVQCPSSGPPDPCFILLIVVHACTQVRRYSGSATALSQRHVRTYRSSSTRVALGH